MGQAIGINWSSDNPKLKCREDLFIDAMWFEKGKEYQLYRAVSYFDETAKEELWTFYLLYEKKMCMFTSKPKEEGYNSAECIYDYFDKKDIDQLIRRAKLEKLSK